MCSGVNYRVLAEWGPCGMCGRSMWDDSCRVAVRVVFMCSDVSCKVVS